jgi:hypothetical protein
MSSRVSFEWCRNCLRISEQEKPRVWTSEAELIEADEDEDVDEEDEIEDENNFEGDDDVDAEDGDEDGDEVEVELGQNVPVGLMRRGHLETSTPAKWNDNLENMYACRSKRPNCAPALVLASELRGQTRNRQPINKRT